MGLPYGRGPRARVLRSRNRSQSTSPGAFRIWSGARDLEFRFGGVEDGAGQLELARTLRRRRDPLLGVGTQLYPAPQDVVIRQRCSGKGIAILCPYAGGDFQDVESEFPRNLFPRTS